MSVCLCQSLSLPFSLLPSLPLFLPLFICFPACLSLTFVGPFVRLVLRLSICPLLNLFVRPSLSSSFSLSTRQTDRPLVRPFWFEGHRDRSFTSTPFSSSSSCSPSTPCC